VQTKNKATKPYELQDFDRKYDETSIYTSENEGKQDFSKNSAPVSNNVAPNDEHHGVGSKYKPLSLEIVNGKEIKYGGWVPKTEDGYYADSGFESGFKTQQEEYQPLQPQRLVYF
jgi:hypothetical protein